MVDEPDDLPDDIQHDFKNFADKFDLNKNEMIDLQIQFLIEEAVEEQQSEGVDSDTRYNEPYRSGPASIWRVTDQMGIDSKVVTWWLASIALNDDGSPFYLIHEGYDQIRRVRIEFPELPRLAEAFRSAERHYIEETTDGSNDQPAEEDKLLPSPSEIPPAKVTDNDWEFILNEEAIDSGESTLAIRRAPVLDHGKLLTYVVELRNYSNHEDAPSSVGAFWGHHGGLFELAIESVVNEIA